jgi:uncharacterized protein DUF2846
MIRKLMYTMCAAALCVPMVATSQDSASAPAADAAAGGNTGTVVFFREKKIVGSAIRYKVRENGKELCKLKNGTFCTVTVAAGKHEYLVHTEAKDALTLDVEAGKTYYVQGAISMGAFAGHPQLSVADQAAFDGMKAKLKDNTGQDLGGDEKE